MTTENAKVLYFQGMGWPFDEEAAQQSDVGNYRICTSFKNLEGKQIFIEFAKGPRYDTKNKRKVITDYALFIPDLFVVTNDPEIDDSNKSRIKVDWMYTRDNYEYTKTDITKWINENLNCDFDTIEVLDEYYGYSVHGGVNGKGYTYNLMEDIELNHDRAKARREAFETISETYRQALNEKYRMIRRLEMDADSITVQCWASDKAMGMIDLPREQRIEVAY